MNKRFNFFMCCFIFSLGILTVSAALVDAEPQPAADAEATEQEKEKTVTYTGSNQELKEALATKRLTIQRARYYKTVQEE